MFTPTPATDGYGEREDMALARDRNWMRIQEAKERERGETDAAIARSQQWGISSTAQPISLIVREMIEQERFSRLLLKSDVIWDVKSIHDAVDEACIALCLDCDEFSANYQDKGNQIDLCLVG